MKGFALAFFCFVALVQSRSTGEQPSSRDLAALGEAPWIVHLRVATSTNNGFLKSCTGSLIDSRWILTSASCLENITFIWTRYGAVNVLNPELVTESGTSSVHVHPSYNANTGENDIALISINRHVESTDNIKPIPLHKSGVLVAGFSRFCGFGESTNGAGDQLSCYEVSVNREDEHLIVTPQTGNAYASTFDHGAPLVTDNAQVGLLVRGPLSAPGAFLAVAPYIEWIESVTELSL